MTLHSEKLREYLAVKANPGLAVFRTLQELRAAVGNIAETIIEEHLVEVRKELQDRFERELKMALREMERRMHPFSDVSAVTIQGVTLQGVKGDQGDKGEKGERGEQGARGELGITPVKGKDYFTDVEVDDFLKAVVPVRGIHYTDGKDGKDGEDGSPDTAEQVRDKLQLLRGFERLDASAIKNLPKEFTKQERIMLHRGGVGFATERLTGQITGNTRIFTVPAHITTNNGMLVWSSQFPFLLFPTTHFTTSGLILTLTSVVDTPQRGTEMWFVYNP